LKVEEDNKENAADPQFDGPFERDVPNVASKPRHGKPTLICGPPPKHLLKTGRMTDSPAKRRDGYRDAS
jgi:hypothetical protein